ncbi:MAG: hypothetical protein HF978_12715 [Desulfobacteraceae bacterium]|nr:hypothetical protein [Desulfobacteraceae bacterium]MBC2756401.1 hypothetical protein [Desulfobacteraceae bacterium]MBC2763531.1 hypothetical protein [ANME-2 cluster archaeon]
MKKLALILALMLIPCSAFGLEMLTDNALDNVTGQSGVSIAADDIQIFLNVERFAWIDCDGYGTELAYGGQCDSSLGGAIYIDNFQIDLLNVNMIGGRGSMAAVSTSESNQTLNGNALGGSTCGVIDLFYDYGNTNFGACLLSGSLAGATNTLGMDNYINVNPWGSTSPNGGFLAKSITIDATMALPLHSAGWRGNNWAHYTGSETIGGVLIGLPTAEIYIGSLVITPRFTAQISAIPAAVAGLCANEGESYGTFELQGITMSILSGWVEIAPTGRDYDSY